MPEIERLRYKQYLCTLMAFRYWFLGIIAFCLSQTACQNGYQKVLKSTDFEYKLLKAKEYYNEGEYIKALPLFEELMTVYKGTKDVEKLYYFYPYCHYGLGDYLIASFYFQNFLDYYPRSEYAEEARFMNAYCYYKMSPNPNLEQTNTAKAVEAFQLFTNTYPDSPKIAECNQLIDEMRAKMEEKSWRAAKLYYDMKDYRAAEVAMNNLLIEYPETAKKEEVEFLILESHFLLAENSIESKLLERYNRVIEHYILFIDHYPSSDKLRDAEKMYNTSLEQKEKLEQQI